VKIYTKTGDEGTTGLFGGQRVTKDAARIEAYGTIDELNAVLGVVRTLGCAPHRDSELATLQRELFILGADLATPLGKESSRIRRIQSDDVERLERVIDDLESQLPPLSSFILPGGCPAGAQLHIARTVCRRAERGVVHLGHEEQIGAEPLRYLNRLADLLFVLARAVNQDESSPESTWP